MAAVQKRNGNVPCLIALVGPAEFALHTNFGGGIRDAPVQDWTMDRCRRECTKLIIWFMDGPVTVREHQDQLCQCIVSEIDAQSVRNLGDFAFNS
jgi:hypothetical protein